MADTIKWVWYVEARRGTPTGHAQADPERMGSAVVVRVVERPDADGNQLARNYLLTCAHVVRDANDRLLPEIVCFPSGFGYARTQDGSRRLGEFKGRAQVAQVSPLSPHPKSEARPQERSAADDWVLLEILEPGFAHASAAGFGSVIPGSALTVVGYPGGAGTQTALDEARARGPDWPAHYWHDQDPVRPAAPEWFEPITRDVDDGMLDYVGADQTRAGMSGGGVFDDRGALVALHRASLDSALRRLAIRTEAIARWLRDSRQVELVQHREPPTSAPAPTRHQVFTDFPVPCKCLSIRRNRLCCKEVEPYRLLRTSAKPNSDHSHRYERLIRRIRQICRRLREIYGLLVAFGAILAFMSPQLRFGDVEAALLAIGLFTVLCLVVFNRDRMAGAKDEVELFQRSAQPDEPNTPRPRPTPGRLNGAT